MTYLHRILAKGVQLFKHHIEPDVVDELGQQSDQLPPFEDRLKVKTRDKEALEMLEGMDEDHYESFQLEVALLQYVTGYLKPLKALWQKNPDLFSKLDKGPDQPLYRGINISAEQLQQLKDKGIPCAKDPISSWSLEFKAAKGIVFDVNYKGESDYQVIFKKDVPRDDRLVCIPCSQISLLDTHEEEKEVLCKNITVTKDDIFKLYQKKKEVPISGKVSKTFYEITSGKL